MKQSRNIYIDIVRAYAIFLVVLGHSIQTFNSEWKTDEVELGIYMFHMPLFIAISGYFFSKSADKYSLTQLIRKRFVQLMFPSLTVGLINVFLIGGGKLLMHSSMDILYLSELLFTGLWFLTVLFILTVVGTIIYKYCKGHFFYIGWLAFWGILYVLPDVWISNQVEFLCPFYIMGIATRNVQWWNIKWLVAFIALGIYIFCFTQFTFDVTMYSMENNCFTLIYFLNSLLRLVSGVSGILVSLYFVKLLMKVGVNYKWLSALGMITLPIYVLHLKILIVNKFAHFSTDNYFLLVLFAAIVMTLTVFIYKVLHRSKFIALFLFGESGK